MAGDIAPGMEAEWPRPGEDGARFTTARSEETRRRQELAESLTILQAKRYERFAIAALKREMSKERAKIDQLAPDSYILSTSVAMTSQRIQAGSL